MCLTKFVDTPSYNSIVFTEKYCTIFHQSFSLGNNNSTCETSLALQFNAMHALCVRLPTVFVLELSAADGTLEGRLLAAFHSYVIFQGAPP